MSADPKLTFDSAYGVSLTIIKMHSTPSRYAISTCVLHCRYSTCKF